MNKNLLVLALGAAFIAHAGHAQTAEQQLESRLRAVEAIMDARLERESVPGAAIGIVHDQALVWSHQYGVESLRTKRPVTDDSFLHDRPGERRRRSDDVHHRHRLRTQFLVPGQDRRASERRLLQFAQLGESEPGQRHG